ncbi:hypothetical protein [Klebsiella aerogenes]|uniref:hypothetical protein n=1 Tax=Klebsiella aerogenes TaxID=548 RepID=UPI001D170887|nr:hypothetical protein [Klebsiella aerogenes]
MSAPPEKENLNKSTRVEYFIHEILGPLSSDAKVKEVADAFKEYWFTGYHPDIGKDAAFARPKRY